MLLMIFHIICKDILEGDIDCLFLCTDGNLDQTNLRNLEVFCNRSSPFLCVADVVLQCNASYLQRNGTEVSSEELSCIKSCRHRGS